MLLTTLPLIFSICVHLPSSSRPAYSLYRTFSTLSWSYSVSQNGSMSESDYLLSRSSFLVRRSIHVEFFSEESDQSHSDVPETAEILRAGNDAV
jgi:hypothetical protein